jgi:putrescine importer
MGRDGVLPKKFFGYLKSGSSTPTYNILLIGGLAFLGAVLLNYIGSAYEHAGELLNFGAFLAFMGVNFACFWQFTVIAKKTGAQSKLVKDTILPLIGFAFCGLIWSILNNLAKTVGGIWFAVGIIYVGFKTNWFRSAPVMIDFRES